MLQVRAEIVCFSYFAMASLRNGPFTFVISSTISVVFVHYIYNVIYKIRVIILDQTGVLGGDTTNFITGPPF